MDKYIDQYFGPNQIKEIKLSKEKTYLDKEKVDIVFANQEKITMPLATLEHGATKDISDFTNLRDAVCDPIAQDILAIFVDSEIKIEDIQYICSTKIPMSINGSLDQAEEKLWNKKKYNVNLMDINKVLIKKDDKSRK